MKIQIQNQYGVFVSKNFPEKDTEAVKKSLEYASSGQTSFLSFENSIGETFFFSEQILKNSVLSLVV